MAQGRRPLLYLRLPIGVARRVRASVLKSRRCGVRQLFSPFGVTPFGPSFHGLLLPQQSPGRPKGSLPAPLPFLTQSLAGVLLWWLARLRHDLGELFALLDHAGERRPGRDVRYDVADRVRSCSGFIELVGERVRVVPEGLFILHRRHPPYLYDNEGVAPLPLR